MSCPTSQTDQVSCFEAAGIHKSRSVEWPTNHAVVSSTDDLTRSALLPLTHRLLTTATVTADGSGRCARGSDRSGLLPGILVDSSRFGIVDLVALNKRGMECLTLGAVGTGASALPPDCRATGRTYRRYRTSMKRRRQVAVMTRTQSAMADCHPYLSGERGSARGVQHAGMPAGCPYKTEPGWRARPEPVKTRK